MKKLYLFLLLCASFVMSYAAPAFPGLISVTQSDGTNISYYLRGDEHFSYKITEDGYLINDNADGQYEYVYMNEDGSFSSYGVPAHNPLDRSVSEQNFVASLANHDAFLPRMRSVRQQRINMARPERHYFPKSGSPRSLIILVSYSDVPFSTPKASFENLANQHDYSANGGTGCIGDYFYECSHGQFSPVFDVYGPYTLPHDRAYYGAQTSSANDCNARQMIIDACTAAHDAGVNFADYDEDNNGFVDNIFVYYAGHNQAEGGPSESIWPHRSSVAYLPTPIVLDGKTLADYACTSEFKGSSGSAMCGIGTFCHEFGHVIGLPDFYDTDYSGGLSAMSNWDIMTSGNYNNSGRTPPTYTAYERFYLGWLTPTPLTDDSTVNCEGSYTLKSLISSNTAYLISKTEHNLVGSGPNPKEFFMLEYRLMEGRDTYTGLAEGMLITHINYNGTTWGSNKPNNDRSCLGYYPVLPNRQQAYGNSSDLYPNVADECNFTLWGEDTPLSRRIQNILDLDTACSFDYVGSNELITLQVKDIDAFMEPVETQFIVYGSGISEDVSLSIYENREFLMRRHTADGSDSYKQTMRLSPDSNQVIFDTIDIKYTPKSVTYDEYQDNRFTVKGTQSTSLTKIAKFRYRNRRPIYITTPTAYDPSEVNANSARLSWSFVADTAADVANIQNFGAKYYLDVYNISNEKQIDAEGFENFPQLNDDWSANFTTYTTSSRKSGERAALLSTPHDTLYTKEYISDIENFSLWISSFSSAGVFYIDAYDYDREMWLNVKTITVTTTTTEDIALNLREGFNRMRFYYAPTSGSLAIDEIKIQTGMAIYYAVKNQYLKDTTFLVENLTVDKEYRFKVRSTDRDERATTPRYENISEFSNEVLFTTKNTKPTEEDEEVSLSVIKVGGTVYYVVYISELKEGDYKLFVYNLDGVLVATLPVTSNMVTLPQLPVNQYIIKYSEEGKNKKSDPMVKFHYTTNLK